jgi:hypothetical protein
MNRLAIAALPVSNDIYDWAAWMHSNAEYYRRRGLVAKERAVQITDLSLKQTFKDVARHWLMLAERVEWLERHQNSQQADKN